MELKTISEIRALNSEEFDNYVRTIAENTELNRELVGPVLQCAHTPYLPVPTPDFIIDYFLAFSKENIESMRWWAITKDANDIYTDDFNAFVWKTGRVYRCIFVDDTKMTLITDSITALEGGVETDYVRNLGIAALEANISTIQEHSTALDILGLRGRTTTIIPEVSGSLLVSEETARFSSAIWFNKIQEKVIILAGIGGIGSYVAFLLGRMHPKLLFLFDDDRVEAVNMAGQLFKTQDIGKFKVNAIAQTLQDYSSYASVFAISEKFTNANEGADIMVCGFDSMEARKTFFTKWKKHVLSKSNEERKHCLFIDGRLAAEEFQVLCIRGDDEYNIRRYEEEFLFSDEEADETLCSYKQTTYMANMIGSIMVNLFTNFVANEIEEGLRDLPFLTTYEADFMIFKTEQ